jgi:hypothetical protein
MFCSLRVLHGAGPSPCTSMAERKLAMESMHEEWTLMASNTIDLSSRRFPGKL